LDSLTEIVDAFQNADGDIFDSIKELSDKASGSISSEISRAESVELSIADALKAEIERAEKAESELSTELSTQVSYLLSNTDLTELDSFAEVSAELVSTVSDAIAELALVDEVTIVLNDTDNTISLSENVAAPASGIRTFSGLIEVSSEPSDDANFSDLSLTTAGYVNNGLNSIRTSTNTADAAIAERLNVTPVVSAFTIGNGVDTAYTCEHALGTMDVIVQIYEIATGATVETESIRVDDQNVSIEFADAPTTTEQPKKKVYLAVRRKNPNVEIDPFSGYLTDKQYLDKKTGRYLIIK